MGTKNLRVLIAGNKGFIGKHLWKCLEKDGYELQGQAMQGMLCVSY